MARWYEAANEASFKRVTEGYVFQSPNPWIFGRPCYYLVNGAQKEEIFALLGRWRLLLITIMLVDFVLLRSFISFVMLFPATFIRLAAPSLQFGTAAFSVLLSMLLIMLIAPLMAVPQIYLNRGLRAPLAYAPRTSERITMADQLPKIALSMSAKALGWSLASGICMMGTSIIGLVNAYYEGESLNVIFSSLAIFAFGAFSTGYITHLIRLRAKLQSVGM